MKFAWDPRKEATNLAKHGVPFSEAEQAFSDPLAVVAFDEVHSPRVENLNFVGGSSERLARESCLSDTLTVGTGSSGLLVPVIGK